MPDHDPTIFHFSRRVLLKGFGLGPLLLRPSLLAGASSFLPSLRAMSSAPTAVAFGDLRYRPHDTAQSPLSEIFRLIPPGADDYITEKYAVEIEQVLAHWSYALRESVANVSALQAALDNPLQAISLRDRDEQVLRSAFGVEVIQRRFNPALHAGPASFLEGVAAWLSDIRSITVAEFEIFAIDISAETPLTVQTRIRYDIVAERKDGKHEERVGSWHVAWQSSAGATWKAARWEADTETLSVLQGPAFIEITPHVLGDTPSYKRQMLHGADYWRTTLDGAVGIDLYCNNGVAVGDFDGDGFDDFYVCQPASLPNRLYRNRGDGTFEDVTEKAGVGVLDNTACALFADFDNRGLQDLLVVCGTGPLLFRNTGKGTFTLKRDAFQFKRPPQGTFTHAAIADYDNDGRLDIYFCLYMYYLGLDQYHYPIPYYDARNGPPNSLFHNEGNGVFVETTQVAGLDVQNNRYSFAAAWGASRTNGALDLFVSNDFGTSQLYRNNGNGTFTDASAEAGVEGVGAGMACCWCDYDNDGHQDVYVPSMWEAAGQRVSNQRQFHRDASPHIRGLYQRHARGNALYHNQGDGTFVNVSQHADVEMGRWSWSSDFLDFDHDGYSDLYIANGYISGPLRTDLASFFWRQVVAKSPESNTPALAYERGWNAINELIRSDYTWHGYARNVFFVNNHDGTFAEISGPVGLDCLEDSRTFAFADIDHDGRLEIILKNRNAPQLRILRNALEGIGQAIALRLRGHQSNRDAIGAFVTVETGKLRQTRYLQAGTGFLAQHSRELFFGVGAATDPIRATVRWPSGVTQVFEHLQPGHRFLIEEGIATPHAAPFQATPAAFSQAAPVPTGEVLPSDVQTWLIQPLKAPGFSLSDATGVTHSLKSFEGSYVLLCFWSSNAPQSIEQLRLLQASAPKLQSARLQVLAIHLANADGIDPDRHGASDLHTGFAILFASDQVAGIYSILYRHLFNRHRDLPIPVAFLVDPSGMIVRVYQGTFSPAELLHDLFAVPQTQPERMRAALPFPGMLMQDAFQRNDFTYGVAMFQHGYLEQAAESFRQVIVAKPDNADAYYNLGTLSLREKNLQQAEEYLQKTVQLRPDYPEAWNNLGMIAAQQGRLDEAIADFQQSLQLRPAYAIALLNIGNLYRRADQFDKAENYLNQALRFQPDDPEISYALGMLYAQQNQTDRAADYLQKAIDLRPDYPEALNNLGVLYVHEQDYAKAEEQFRKGMEAAPQYDQSYLNLARLYLLTSNRQKARDVLDQLLRIAPGNAAAKQMLEMLQ